MMRRDSSLAVLWACTRQAFGPEHRAFVEDTAGARHLAWRSIAAIAERDGVAPVVASNLASCDRDRLRIPADVAAQLDRAWLDTVAAKAQRALQLEAGLRSLAEAGYQMLLLKSAALERTVYRDPWVTSARDVDLMLRVAPGAQLAADERERRRALYPYGVECDLQGHHDLSLHDVLPLPFDAFWRDALAVAAPGVAGGRLFVPNAADHLLVLCVNACRKRYFRLKSVFDIAESVRGYPALDWAFLRQRARAARCEAIVATALLATARTVGLPPGTFDIADWVGTGRRHLLDAGTDLLAPQRARMQEAGLGRRLALAALQHASFTPSQSWRSLCLTLSGRGRPVRSRASQKRAA